MHNVWICLSSDIMLLPHNDVGLLSGFCFSCHYQCSPL
ncbi:hypothetical protein SALWKB12_1382 [Snodgrassella communis]|nr:hypothetical protein SALWKB12_1382 [Snodgrassella communis]